MKNNSRRDFLISSAVLGGGAVMLRGPESKAQPRNILSEDRMGVLVDTTVCIGCRNCEWACKKAHDMPAGELEEYKNRNVFNEKRRPNEHALTVVNEYENEKNKVLPIDVKVQCMHCDHPACVSACIVGAFSKQENGSVIWDTNKCIGCRYCIAACPFQIPVFEYHKAIQPDIKKCDFCFNRTKVGKLPACVDICPMEVMTYGTRADVIKLARERLRLYPDRYINHVYGEKEVGGTAWIYLASKEFVDLQFPKLKEKTAPGVSESIQHGIFSYFVPPVALYSLLGGLMWITKKRNEMDNGE